MASNNESKEIDIKNHTCYYFDDIINVNDLDLDNILLYGYYLIYDAAYKTPYGPKPLRIIFDTVYRYIKNTMELNIKHFFSL